MRPSGESLEVQVCCAADKLMGGLDRIPFDSSLTLVAHQCGCVVLTTEGSSSAVTASGHPTTAGWGALTSGEEPNSLASLEPLPQHAWGMFGCRQT